MLGGRRFLSMQRLRLLCKRSGLGEKSPRSKKLRVVSPESSLPIWSKQRSGKSWLTRRRRGICWSTSRSTRLIANFPSPCSHLTLRPFCHHRYQTPFCQKRKHEKQQSRPIRSRRFLVRLLIPPIFPKSFKSTFTGIGEPLASCWPGQPKRE